MFLMIFVDCSFLLANDFIIYLDMKSCFGVEVDSRMRITYSLCDNYWDNLTV